MAKDDAAAPILLRVPVDLVVQIIVRFDKPMSGSARSLCATSQEPAYTIIDIFVTDPASTARSTT